MVAEIGVDCKICLFDETREAHDPQNLLRGGSGTEPEPETGTVGTVFPETESGTAGTVFQEPKPEPEPSFAVKNVLEHRRPPFLQRNRRNRKPEPLEPFHPQTVAEPNRTGATLLLGLEIPWWHSRQDSHKLSPQHCQRQAAIETRAQFCSRPALFFCEQHGTNNHVSKKN